MTIREVYQIDNSSYVSDIESYHDNNESISIHNLGNCAARSHCFGKLFNVLQTGDLSATATPS